MSYCVVRCWCCTTPCTTLYDASYAPDASGPDALYDAPTRRTMHFRQHSKKGGSTFALEVNYLAKGAGVRAQVRGGTRWQLGWMVGQKGRCPVGLQLGQGRLVKWSGMGAGLSLNGGGGGVASPRGDVA